MMQVIHFAGFCFLFSALYIIPGWSVLRLFAIDGLSRTSRLLFSVLISLVIVPFCFSVMAAFVPFIPQAWHILAGSLILLGIGWQLKRKKLQPVLSFRTRIPIGLQPSRTETIAIGILILAFSVLIHMPRLDALLNGNQETYLGNWDAAFHLSQTLAIARSGLPPAHYFFPDAPLSYYYWSWILPAVAQNQPLIDVTVARAISVAALFQTAAFLALVYWILRRSVRSASARVWTMLFLTILGGGLDYIASGGPHNSNDEAWQNSFWISGGTEISSFFTIYAWVPQHLAGAMGFFLLIVDWRHLRGSLVLRAILAGVLIAFIFGTSAFVFLALIPAILLFLVYYRRILRQRKTWLIGLLSLVVCLAGVWRQILLMVGNQNFIVWGTFQFRILALYFGAATEKVAQADRLLTLGLLPVVIGIVLTVEMGAVFILYLGWLFRGNRRMDAWSWFLIWYPLLCAVLIFLFTSSAGINFQARGFIPAQFCIVFAAAKFLEDFRWGPLASWKKVILVYVGVIFLFAQSFWAWDELRVRTAPAIGGIIHSDGEKRLFGFLYATEHDLPESLRYIRWANQNTPADALFIQEGLATNSKTSDIKKEQFRFLERMQWVDESVVSIAPDFWVDLNINHIPNAASALSLRERALQSAYVRQRRPPIFDVVRGQTCIPSDDLVYADAFVCIYRVLLQTP
jgi:hypothetical protein